MWLRCVVEKGDEQLEEELNRKQKTYCKREGKVQDDRKYAKNMKVSESEKSKEITEKRKENMIEKRKIKMCKGITW